ncbi:MAG: hypothetical protein HQL01_02840 [Nitrospirae bacterium]|nr:hypothetical protein [Nitrospirota bacterium]
MPKKQQIIDKLSALNPSVPTQTRTQPDAPAIAREAGKIIKPRIVPEPIEKSRETPIEESAVIATSVRVTPPVFNNAGGCTFTLFVDNLSALMQIQEVLNNNFHNINSMMVDSYKKTLTITFDTLRHNYGQFAESLRYLMPSATRKKD